ncbi:MAG TPA: MFS transporter [Xanthobacteraceae bacterium]|jgi:DHA2 family methylenomycin A resistance protein-like MFS transporter|nr:MFS transporter [Xanthobacteraceae bacterium]
MPAQMTAEKSRIVASGAPAHRWLTLLTLCIAVLIAQLDTSVVNLGVHPIGDYFHADIGALQWVVDSYNLLYAVLLLTGGLLADLYGRRRVFMAGAALFTVSSLMCAIAPSVVILIGARALSGVGAALLLPASLAIIRVVWTDARERGTALGVWTGCNGLALAIGPTLGGVLIEHFGWRSIFFVVVPLGIAAVILALWAVPESSDPQNRRFDATAQILGAVALGSLALAAIESHGAGGNAILAVISLVVAVAASGLFIMVERKIGAGALVPLEMFSNSRFRGVIAATTGMTFGMYGLIFLLPLTWQSAGRLDAVWAGIALTPMAAVYVLVSPFSGWLSGKLGQRFMTGGGVAIIGLGVFLVGLTTQTASLIGAEIGLALTGLGMGLATGPLMDAAVGAVSAARSGTAAALINTARMIGATIGVAVLGALYSITGGGTEGLRAAMLVGGVVQLACATTAWFATAAKTA